MSTTFGIITKSGEERPIARRVGGKNGLSTRNLHYWGY
jgi:hypothetical protein